jgi:NAD(P)-dependent dehydrogenase (short-subunit alcohol dehydrogenase family)
MFRWIIFSLFLLSFNMVSADEKKVVLITGASRGIGLATAEHLADKGFCVYAGVRKSDGLKNEKVHFTELDVTDESTIQKAIHLIVEKEGHLDILINNAAFAVAGPLECQTIAETQEQMNVNFFGVIRMCQAVLPQMRKQKSGHIINISSEQSSYGLPYGSLYTSSKAALNSLSEALSVELVPWHINVSIVEPGMVATGFSVKMGSRQVDNNPYASVCEKIASSLTEERKPSATCQTPEQVAAFLYTVIASPQPQLRYQTSSSAETAVGRFAKDLSGKKYLKWMRPLMSKYYSR